MKRRYSVYVKGYWTIEAESLDAARATAEERLANEDTPWQTSFPGDNRYIEVVDVEMAEWR